MTALPTGPPAAAESRDDRVLAIRDLVEQVQRHQNDLAEFLDLHTDDASIVNLAGRRVLGKHAIHDAMSQALQTPLADVITTAEVDDIRFVRPDLAVVSCTKHVFDHRDESLRDGADTSVPSAGRLTYVVVADQGRWRIVSAQTTPILTA